MLKFKTIFLFLIFSLLFEGVSFSSSESEKRVEIIKIYNMGIKKYNARIYNEAKKYFEDALVKKPDYIKAWYMLARCYYKLKDYETAKNICNSLINDLKVTSEYKIKIGDLLKRINEKLKPTSEKQIVFKEEIVKPVQKQPGADKNRSVKICMKDGNVIRAY